MTRLTYSLIALSAAGALGLATASCGGRATADSSEGMAALEQMPVVAQLGADSVMTADLSLAGPAITLRLSDLTESPEIVRLDNSDEALVGQGATWVSDSRIIVYDHSSAVAKMFDRSGRYLGDIGSRGQGPGEYAIAPYDIYVDDNAGRVYLAQYAATRLMVYDAADGSYIGDIPLAYKLEKGRVHVDTPSQTVTVASMPFADAPSTVNVWTQDFDGNILSSVSRPGLTVIPDYSNEIEAGTAAGGDGFDYSLFSIYPHADSLYVYEGGTLRPAFTAALGSGDDVLMHEYLSAPQFYAVVLFNPPRQVDESSYVLPSVTPLIIDRTTGRGAFAGLLFDNIGPLSTTDNWLQQSSGDYFVMSFDPGTLAELIDEAAKASPDDPATAAMISFGDSIDADDNNYIILGRWKR